MVVKVVGSVAPEAVDVIVHSKVVTPQVGALIQVNTKSPEVSSLAAEAQLSEGTTEASASVA